MTSPKTNISRDNRAGRSLRSTLVEPFKQIKIGVYVLVLSLLFLVSAAALIGVAFYQQYGHVMEIFQVVDPTAQWEVVTNDIFYYNALKIGGLALAYMSVLFFVIFRMTHKIYGPLVSIERFVDAIGEGDYGKRIVIRRGDELQRLTMRLNAMADALEKKYGKPDRRQTASHDVGAVVKLADVSRKVRE